MDAIEILTNEDLGNGCHLIKARGPLAQWTMERPGDDEPWFPSIPLARILGYARVRKFHELIRRLYPTEIEFRPTVGRNSPGDGEVYFRLVQTGGRGRPEREYLLTRRQVMKLIMRSETPRADGLQDELVEVLLRVMRDQELRNPPGLTQLHAQFAQLQGRLIEVQQQVLELQRLKLAQSAAPAAPARRPRAAVIERENRPPMNLDEEVLQLLGRPEYARGLRCEVAGALLGRRRYAVAQVLRRLASEGRVLLHKDGLAHLYYLPKN